MREIELKFAVHPTFHIDAICGQAGVDAINSLSALTLTATYYDTPDLRLARNGVTLRFRTGESDPQWTVKLPCGMSGMVREELMFSGPPDTIPPDVVDVVTGYRRGAAMQAVATLVTRRERWELLDEKEAKLAVVYQDEVSVVEDSRTLTHFREIELESLGIGLKRLRRIGDALAAAGAVTTEPVPKAVRALGPRATAPPDIPDESQVRGETAADALQKMIVRAVHRITTHHAAARLGDPEGVHQMRVGTRRLRSDLRTFASLVDREWADSVLDDLRWLARVLGEVRDIDVLTERFAQSAGELADELQSLFDHLRRVGEQRRSDLHDALRSERYLTLLESLVRAAQNPPATVDAAVAGDEVLVPQVRPTWDTLRKAMRAAGEDPPDHELHEIRIHAKRARYAAEVVAGSSASYASSAKNFARAAAALQEVLGEHQDAVVAQQTLRGIAGAPESTASVQITLGRLIERQHQEALHARAQWTRSWHRLSRPKNTEWLTG